MAERSLTGKRSDVIDMDPFGVVVVGVDKPYENAGPEHPRYDPRVKMPFDGEDEQTIATIIKHGIISPIRVAPEKHPKTGETIHVVVAGRRRTLMAREAQRRLKAAGKSDKIMLPVLPPMSSRAGWSADDLDEVQIIENEHRRADEGLVLAEKIATFVKRRGGDAKARKEAQTTFKKSEASIDGYLLLNGAIKEVKDGYTKGKYGVTAAIELARAPADKQKEKLEKLMAAPKQTAEEAREIVRPAANKPDGDKPRAFSASMARKALAAEGAKEVLEACTALDAFRLFAGEVTMKKIPGLAGLFDDGGGNAE